MALSESKLSFLVQSINKNDFFFLLADICGDNCIFEGNTCICGKEAFSENEMLDQNIYCCAPEGSCGAENKS